MLKKINILFHFIFCINLYANNFKSYVDKNIITSEETISITFEYLGQASGNPDFSVLQKDFSIISNSQGSQTTIINGQRTQKSTWQLELLPKINAKKLVIPRITYGQESTDEIIITISNIQKNSNNNTDIIFEAFIDKKEAYITEQVTLTLSLKTTQNLYKGNIQEPVIAQAIIEPLGELIKKEEVINGINTYIFQKNYAIFFNKPNTYKIPPLIFEGQIPQKQSHNFFGMPNAFTTSKKIFVKTDEIAITIKDQPLDFPANTPFLALDELIISEVFDQKASYDAGDALSRKFIIKGIKTLSSLLPTINPLNINGIKIYSEAGKKSNEFINNNLEAKFELSHTYIPQKRGVFHIDKQIIYWWDTKNNKLNQSEIRALDLNIVGPIQEEQLKEEKITQAAPDLKNNYSWIWIVISLSLLLIVIIISLLLFKKKYKKIIIKKQENNILSELKQSIKNKDLSLSYKLLVKLKNQERLEQDIIIQTLKNMEIKLYNPQKSSDITIDFDALLKALENKDKKENNATDLKPFYPN